jgi:molecular chaperone HscC
MIVGIDLGTTNSAVGVWREGASHLIPNRLGQLLTPSAVSLGDAGEVIVGLAARERQVTHPERTATAFKRYMGSQRSLTLGGRTFNPEELSALVLRSLKEDAEQFLGETVTDAVITVPAYFNDVQRKATRRAGELAGLRVERLVNEPTAAALAYGIHELKDESRFLVFDLGGGTFDVSVLEIFEGVIEVRASTGDNFLGGEDFNELLIEDMFARFRDAWRVAHPSEDPRLYQRIRDQAERARRELSGAESASMRVIWNEEQYEHLVELAAFEKRVEGLIERLRVPVLRALRDANLRVDQLDQIILVGGATRMPVVRKAVARMFGRFPASQVNPDEVVALGAAVQAGLKARDVALKEVVLTDVCPYTLGVDVIERLPGGELRDGVFAPIIERNTVIPASRARVFHTVQDGQRLVAFGVYQGESRLVKDNVRLGAIEMPVPARRAGEVAVECRFTYDIDGLLEIDALVPSTGERRQVVIRNESSSLTSVELSVRREMLAALKVHPRDQEPNRAALARASRAYEQFLGDKREAIGEVIRQFEAVLERQDPREVEVARRGLHAFLDEIEGQRFL